jgi:Bifunctional DNA primase/polymerase, N-terminal/Primase C terminal 2 (PriCT-2)/Family of unknown function (DUF5906)
VLFDDYAAHGWFLCAIDRGKKAPTYDDWNTKPIPADAVGGLDGAGLLHALSGTCALDVDNMDAARPWLAERGVDIDALLADDRAVTIDSGRHGRAKLLYRMKRPLRTFKPKGAGLELRCATATGLSVQDVLPPSVHPDTKKPYEWGGGLLGDWRKPPSVPAVLLALWRSMAEEPSAEPIPPREPPRVDLVKLRKAAFAHSPDCEYDEWIKVGMQLHDGTGGAQEGFDIWADWSRGIKRKAYPGEPTLKSHWLSFSSQGKHAAKGESLVAELPAEADEFPLVTAADAAPVEAEAAKADRKEAMAILVKRLVFVASADRYFDTDTHRVYGTDHAISHMFTPMLPRKGGRPMDPVMLLKGSRERRTVDGLAFHPGEGALFDYMGDSFANAYRNRLPEPIEPTKDELEKIEWLFDRIDDPLYRQWLKQFFAHVIQEPGVKIKSAPLIWSDTQGNGKTTLLKMIPSLLTGNQYSKEVTFSLLNSDFNDYLLNAWHVNLTEFRAGTRGEREAISKKIENWIADDVISIHPKGMPGYTMPNHLFITATSNKDDAAAIDMNDRKWAIYELNAPQFTEKQQRWIYNEFLLTPRAAGVVRHYFLNVDLRGFVASARAIETEARAAMVRASTVLDHELLATAYEQISEPLARDVVITADVGDYVRRHCPSKPSNDRIGKILCRAPFNGEAARWRVGQARYRGVVIRNHDRWRGAGGVDIMSHIAGDDADLTS